MQHRTRSGPALTLRKVPRHSAQSRRSERHFNPACSLRVVFSRSCDVSRLFSNSRHVHIDSIAAPSFRNAFIEYIAAHIIQKRRGLETRRAVLRQLQDRPDPLRSSAPQICRHPVRTRSSRTRERVSSLRRSALPRINSASAGQDVPISHPARCRRRLRLSASWAALPARTSMNHSAYPTIGVAPLQHVNRRQHRHGSATGAGAHCGIPTASCSMLTSGGDDCGAMGEGGE